MNSNKNATVIVIVDRSFGGRLQELATDSHTWIIDTPINRAQVTEIWNRHKSLLDYKSLTIYHDTPSLSPDEMVTAMIWTIEEHHPGFNRLDVRGTNATPKVLKALKEYGFGGVESQTDGFVVTR